MFYFVDSVMKLVIQNVDKASVVVNSEEGIVKKKEEIGKGVLIYFGVSKNTTNELGMGNVELRIDKFVDKMQRMRWLKNNDGRLDATIGDIGGEILIVSNFTLYADNKKGTKMDFSASGEYEKAEIIYKYFVNKLKENFVVKTGEFGGMMKVESINDGPVNYVLEI
ncbi:MAG TPA: D-aminoacyl-tRNA deacylase [Candidatus Absconditabacterales bacterium]|nr:D-aminoacyl-tRNA deacylase [Candidatus Absconditabacterales bacterium]